MRVGIKRLWASALACAVVLLLQACGAGTQIVAGSASYGVAMAGATITVRSADGKTLTEIAGPDGTYAANVFGFQAPLLLTATVKNGNGIRSYNTLVTELPIEGEIQAANITPLTDAIVALSASTVGDIAEFHNPAALAALDLTKVQAARQQINTAISSIVASLELPADFDPQTSLFMPQLEWAGNRVLEVVKVSIARQSVTLFNALIPIPAAEGATLTAKVVLTPGSASTPLPLHNIDFGYQGAMVALQAQLGACLALAPADRLDFNTNGTAVALKGACAEMSVFAQDYKREGRDLFATWRWRLENLPAGTTVGMPEVVWSVESPQGANPGVTVRIPLNYGGEGKFYNEVVRKQNDVWVASGNHFDYEAGIQMAIRRFIDVSRNDLIPSAGPDVGKPVGNRSRLEAALRLVFVPKNDVYAVRVSGPGLPAAGLVLTRSTVCGGSSQLSILRNDGVVPAAPADGSWAAAAQTGATVNSMETFWRMNAVPIGNYTGTDFWNQLRGYATDGSYPNTASVAEAPMDLDALPEFSTFKLEVYLRSGVVHTEYRTEQTRPFSLANVQAFPWAQLAPETVALLDPANPLAGGISSAILNWSVVPGLFHVDQGGLYGETISATGAPQKYFQRNGVMPIGSTSHVIAPAGRRDGFNNFCQNTTIPAYNHTRGRRELELTQLDGMNTRYVSVYAFHGRERLAPVSVPAGELGLSSYSADAHPAALGSVTLPDGTVTEFRNSGSTSSAAYTTAAGGVMTTYMGSADVSAMSRFRQTNAFRNDAVYPKYGTLVARVRGTDPTRRAMYLDMAFSDVGTKGARFQMGIEPDFNTLNGMLFFNLDQSVPVGAETNVYGPPIDALNWHTYHIAVTLTGPTQGTVRVYIDGNNVPVIDRTLSSIKQVNNPGDNFVQIGEGSTNFSSDGQLDWAVWTHTGAYTPAQLQGRIPASLGDITGY